MRRRVVKEVGTIAGIAVILLGVVFINAEMGRTSLKDRMEKLRKRIEQERTAEGLTLLNWEIMRKTTGGVRSGPTFDPRLLKLRDIKVDLIGFMVGLDQFRNIKEFMLLPLPLECYFCQAPPMHDVVLVQMAEGLSVKDLYREPVLINGTLTLNEGPGTKFFYVIKDASLGAGKPSGTLTAKEVPLEHRLPHAPKEDQVMSDGYEPPKAGGASALPSPK